MGTSMSGDTVSWLHGACNGWVLTIADFFQTPAFECIEPVFLADSQPAFSNPFEEVEPHLLDLDTDMRCCREQWGIWLGWMRA